METTPFHVAVEKYTESVNTIIEFNQVSAKIGAALKDISEQVPVINKYLDVIPTFNVLQNAYLESFARWRKETPKPSYDRAIQYIINERLTLPRGTKADESKGITEQRLSEQNNKGKNCRCYLWSMVGLAVGVMLGFLIISL